MYICKLEMRKISQYIKLKKFYLLNKNTCINKFIETVNIKNKINNIKFYTFF